VSGQQELPGPHARRGLTHGLNEWGVGRYETRNGWLRQLGPPARVYEPAEHRQVVTDLAKLHDGDENAVLAFADHWGRLGQGVLIAKASGVRDQPREPLDWIWAHARTVRLCLDLLNYLQKEDEQGLTDFLPTLQLPSPTPTLEDPIPPEALPDPEDNWPGGVYPWRSDIVNTWDWRGPRRLALANGGGVVHLARNIVADIVSRQIGGLGWVLRETERGFALGFSFAALIEIVYWHIGRFAEELNSLGLCEACGNYFHKTHGKQQYCPASEDWAESRCGRRARRRRGERPVTDR
jgi:hypothetical protein